MSPKLERYLKPFCVTHYVILNDILYAFYKLNGDGYRLTFF